MSNEPQLDDQGRITFDQARAMMAKNGIELLHPDHEQQQAALARDKKRQELRAELRGLLETPGRKDMAKMTRLQNEIRALG